MDTGQVGRGERACANVAGRGGRRERTSREGRAVASPSVQLTQQSQVTGLDGSTRARQTDRQTCTLRPPGGPGQPVPWGMEPAHLSILGGSPPSLGAHDLPGPRLVGSVWGQLGEHHLHGLELLVLGWDGAHLVGHLVTLHGDVVPLDVRHVHEDVL